jgi:pyrroloquinoline quinone biosynthesis protein B
MKIRVLGSAAGGGFPQWNCNCSNCKGLRTGTIRARARTQSSIAASADGRHWVLFNASPDVLQQIKEFPGLQPGEPLRATGITAIVLMDGQVDHTTGLYMLREHNRPLELWCTDPVHQDLTTGNPILKVLGHFAGVNRHALPVAKNAGDGFRIPGIEGLRFEAMALKSKAPPYSPHRDDPQPGDNIGMTIVDEARGRRLFYAPGLGEIEPHVRQAMHRADCVLVDGTCWTDDELVALGVSKKRARDIGHLAQSGPGGMIERLDELPKSTRRVLIHINNTNPILNEDGPERAELTRHGIEVSHDGMEIDL